MTPDLSDVQTSGSYFQLRLGHLIGCAAAALDPAKSSAHRAGELARMRRAFDDLGQIEQLVVAVEEVAAVLQQESLDRETKTHAEAVRRKAEADAAGTISAAVQSLRIPIS